MNFLFDLINKYYIFIGYFWHAEVSAKQLVIFLLIWIISSFIGLVCYKKYYGNILGTETVFSALLLVFILGWPLIISFISLIFPISILLGIIILCLRLLWYRIFPKEILDEKLEEEENKEKLDLIEKDTSIGFCPNCHGKSAYRS